MTPDEACAELGVSRGATRDEIREAFRRRARLVHPDRHPEATTVDRAQLSARFDRARRARDVLENSTAGPLGFDEFVAWTDAAGFGG